MIKKFFYILTIILFFVGCEHNSNKKLTETNKSIKVQKFNKTDTKKENKLIIKEKDFNITFINSKLIYPKDKMVLLFSDGSIYSKEEEKILKKLNIKFHKTKNKFLESYFKISCYPTIIVLDKNKTITYQNFMPYEMIKTQGF